MNRPIPVPCNSALVHEVRLVAYVWVLKTFLDIGRDILNTSLSNHHQWRIFYSQKIQTSLALYSDRDDCVLSFRIFSRRFVIYNFKFRFIFCS
jgi:hypothetical protein